MSAPTRLSAQLAHAGWAVLSWVGDAVSGRRALVQDRLSEQLGLNARLIAGLHQGAAGGAE
jgi:hypothetical protein